jgi:hypothetical protein
VILLTQPTDFLELQTGAALSTDWTCSWVDVNFAASTFVPGSAEGNVAAVLSTLLAGSPAAGVQRQIKYLSVVNRDAAAMQTVTIDKNSGAAFNLTGHIPLAPGDSLQYVDSRGFFVLNAQGFEKFIGATGPAGGAGATGPPGQGPPGTDGEAGEDAWPMPGTPGAPGPMGPAVFLEADAGEQGDPGVGVPGAPGAPGATGAQQPLGAFWVNSAFGVAVALPVNAVPRVVGGPYNIKRVVVLTEGGPGSCVINVWKANLSAHYPPLVTDDITGGANVVISSGTTHDDSTLTGWSTGVVTGDVFLFSLASTSTFTYIEIQVFLG